MGQDISGTELATTAAAASRIVGFQFLVDWADAGFDDTASWTDETQFVQNVRGDQQATDWTRSIATIGRGVADACYVTCRNPEVVYHGSGLRFSASNASGPLYAYIGDGQIHMKRAVVLMGFLNSDADYELLRQVTGYIVGVTENHNQRSVTFEIRDRGADAALSTVSSALYTNQSAKTYMAALVADMERDPVAVGDQLFDRGMVLTPYQWCEDDNLWSEMSTVAEAQLGRVWFDKDGDLHFDDGAHFVKVNANSYDDPLTVQATFTVASFADCQPQWSFDNIYNSIVVEYTPRYTGEEQIIYNSAETLVIKPGGGLSHRAETRYPVFLARLPEANTDYTATTGGGTDITGDITITSENSYATRSDLLIANGNTNYTAYLTNLQIRGLPLLASNIAKYETSDSTSIGRYGKRSWVVRNPYVQTYRHAELIGDFLLSRYKDPIMSITLKGIPARPWLEVGDRVTVAESLTGIDEDFFIGRVEWQWNGRAYTQNLHLMRISDLFPYDTYFTVRTHRYGKYARLFW